MSSPRRRSGRSRRKTDSIYADAELEVEVRQQKEEVEYLRRKKDEQDSVIRQQHEEKDVPLSQQSSRAAAASTSHSTTTATTKNTKGAGVGAKKKKSFSAKKIIQEASSEESSESYDDAPLTSVNRSSNTPNNATSAAKSKKMKSMGRPPKKQQHLEEEDEDNNTDSNSTSSSKVVSDNEVAVHEDEPMTEQEYPLGISESSSEDDDDDDDNDEEFNPKANHKKNSPTPKKRQRGTPSKKKKKVQLRPLLPLTILAPNRNGPNSNANAAYFKKQSGSGNTGRRKSRLATLMITQSKKVLEPSEIQDLSHHNDSGIPPSLLAQLLRTYTSSPPNTLLHTHAISQIASQVLTLHRQDPNAAQCQLLNWLFRSIGGSTQTSLNPSDVSLESLDHSEWGDIVTDLVDEMRHVSADVVLLCADPDGCVHNSKDGSEKNSGSNSAAPVSPAVMMAREYHRLYGEFWYCLAAVALDDSRNNTSGEDIEDDESSDDDECLSAKKKRRTSGGKSLFARKGQKSGSGVGTSRFDAELVRDLILRVSELVSVGQPDLRSAATVAALQMAHAILDRTVILSNKLQIASRQLTAAEAQQNSSGNKRKSKSPIPVGAKVQSLRHRVTILKRTKADLEEVVMGPVVNGIVMHRYRDSNEFLRSMTLNSMSRMTLQRPDVFLCDKYLKYFGWLTSDHSEIVRVAAIQGLLAPFQKHLNDVQTNGGKKRGAASPKNSNVPSQTIDLSLMENVITKFIPRLADCMIDVSISVQEISMNLLLVLLRQGFLDDVENDNLWSQINLRALASDDASPAVRRDALYFVMEQLEAFDEMPEDSETPFSKSKKRSSSGANDNIRASQRIDALASWVAHALTDGPCPTESIQIHLMDLIVYSVRSMPEHHALMTNWTAMLKAILDDKAAITLNLTSAGDRADVAKQRVLVRMLATAACVEVGSVTENPTSVLGEKGVHMMEEAGIINNSSFPIMKHAHKSQLSSQQWEELSIALLHALPDLLMKFIGDSAILASLTLLPRYLIPTIFSHPARKQDFARLLQLLSKLYCETCQDEIVLGNLAHSLRYLMTGDHARVGDAKLEGRGMVQTLKGRLETLWKEAASEEDSNRRKSKRGGGKQDSMKDSSNRQFSIALNLKRLHLLSERWNTITEFMGGDEAMENTCGDIMHSLSMKLKESQINTKVFDDSHENGSDGENVSLLYPRSLSDAVRNGMGFCLCSMAWLLHKTQEDGGLILTDMDVLNQQDDDDDKNEDMEDDDEAVDHVVLRLRNQLVDLTELCFDQFLPDFNHDDQEEGSKPPSEEQKLFSDRVQSHAYRTASDLRTLFPKQWIDADSKLLRNLALMEDGKLIGGSVRYFRSKEGMLREKDVKNQPQDALTKHERQQANDEIAKEMLLPLGRALATNWAQGNRREAGVVLAHLTGSSHEAGMIVADLSRVLKKVEPVRLLEAHMASLRQSYDDWIDAEPEELETDRPSDEEMNAFEEAERAHVEQFKGLETQAARLSMSLGVGRLSNQKLVHALLGFIKEGIRYSFSTTGDGANNNDEDDDELVLGSRLTFLSLLNKYANWIKRNRKQKVEITKVIDIKQEELYAHQDFKDVHEDDLAALEAFRESLGVSKFEPKEPVQSTPVSQMSLESDGRGRPLFDETLESIPEMTVTPSSGSLTSGGSNSAERTPLGSLSSGSKSTGNNLRRSSVLSSKASTSRLSSLSPLYEQGIEEGDEEDEVDDTLTSPLTNASFHTNVLQSTPGTEIGETQSTFDGKSQSTYEGRTQTDDEESGQRSGDGSSVDSNGELE